MADNYTQSSFIIPVPEERLQELKEWLKAFELERDLFEDDTSSEYWEKYDGYMYELYEHSMTAKGLWVYGEDSINIESAVWFTQKVLTDLNIEGGIYISWADTCSKPRIGEFGGGGVVVTKNDEYWVTSYDVVHSAESNGVEILN